MEIGFTTSSKRIAFLGGSYIVCHKANGDFETPISRGQKRELCNKQILHTIWTVLPCSKLENQRDPLLFGGMPCQHPLRLEDPPAMHPVLVCYWIVTKKNWLYHKKYRFWELFHKWWFINMYVYIYMICSFFLKAITACLMVNTPFFIANIPLLLSNLIAI
jgi:hypothetical protein